jgi:hypothetical protein
MKRAGSILRSGLVRACQAAWFFFAVVAVPPAQQPSAPNAPASPALSTNAPVKEIAPGIFQVGAVRLDKAGRALTFPATLNMNEGLIEYLVVTTSGKTHESLLRTEVEPLHLQVAMLLLGAKGAQAKPLSKAPVGGPLSVKELAKADAEAIKGEPVSIEVQWTAGGKKTQRRIEELVLSRATKSPMSKGDFVFNGSRVWEGTFVAQRDGSIISTIIDPDAMFNNPRPGREDDQIWEIIKKKAPAVGTPVELTITLKSDPGKAR